MYVVSDFVKLKQGDWLIQNALNSNVGRYLIALAKLHSIKTVNIVRREDIIPEFKQLGSTEIIIDKEHMVVDVLSRGLIVLFLSNRKNKRISH